MTGLAGLASPMISRMQLVRLNNPRSHRRQGSDRLCFMQEAFDKLHGTEMLAKPLLQYPVHTHPGETEFSELQPHHKAGLNRRTIVFDAVASKCGTLQADLWQCFVMVNSGIDRAEHVAHMCGSEGEQLITRLVLAAINVDHVTDIFELGVQQGRAATTLQKLFDLTPMVCLMGTTFLSCCMNSANCAIHRLCLHLYMFESQRNGYLLCSYLL